MMMIMMTIMVMIILWSLSPYMGRIKLHDKDIFMKQNHGMFTMKGWIPFDQNDDGKMNVTRSDGLAVEKY